MGFTSKYANDLSDALTLRHVDQLKSAMTEIKIIMRALCDYEKALLQITDPETKNAFIAANKEDLKCWLDKRTEVLRSTVTPKALLEIRDSANRAEYLGGMNETI